LRSLAREACRVAVVRDKTGTEAASWVDLVAVFLFNPTQTQD
jgi:hypothetical protein